MRRTCRGSTFSVAACLVVAITGLADAATPEFKPTALPPPEAEEAPAPSLYDIFEGGDTSPLGTSAKTVKSSDLIDQAASFLDGSNGHKANTQEAAFWLKRAIRMAPDESGKRRAWAATNLGLLMYNSGGATGHASARYLWEMAGAWNSPEALCNLGQLAEIGDDVAKADPKKAAVWYERAQKAGCAQAAQALSRLPH